MIIRRSRRFLEAYLALVRGKGGIDAKLHKQIEKALRFLEQGPPWHGSLQVHKTEGTGDIWEIYVNRDIRMTYDYEDVETGSGRRKAVRLRNIGHHSMLDRDP